MSKLVVALTWGDSASIAGVIAASAAVIALLVSLVGYVRSRMRTHREREVAVAESFRETVRGLSDEKKNQQFTSAVLLRRFFDRDSEYGAYLPFSTDVVNVIAAVLRGEPAGHLQKLLADGLAHAPSLRGVDLQNTNLRNAYLSQVDIRGADFFRSDLSYASLKGAKAEGARFYQALLLGTTFEGADLRNANFFEADLSNAKFDGARLAGARFDSVRRLPACILGKLDEAGTYQCPAEETCHDPAKTAVRESQARIFLSQPRTVTAYQQSVLAVVQETLEDIGLVIETAASGSYSSSSPLHHVSAAIERCDGTVVVGIPQLDIEVGRLKPGTSEESGVSGQKLPTPWNQIEAGMSVAHNHPLLVIRDGTFGGIFDISGDGEDLVDFDLGLPWDLEGLRVVVRTWALKFGHHDLET